MRREPYISASPPARIDVAKAVGPNTSEPVNGSEPPLSADASEVFCVCVTDAGTDAALVVTVEPSPWTCVVGVGPVVTVEPEVPMLVDVVVLVASVVCVPIELDVVDDGSVDDVLLLDPVVVVVVELPSVVTVPIVLVVVDDGAVELVVVEAVVLDAGAVVVVLEVGAVEVLVDVLVEVLVDVDVVDDVVDVVVEDANGPWRSTGAELVVIGP